MTISRKRFFGLNRRGSITTRLVVGLTLATTLLWCVGVAYAAYSSYHELNEAFDDALRETAAHLLPLTQDDLRGHEQDDAHAIKRMTDKAQSYLSYQLRDASGTVLLRARGAPAEPFDETLSEGFSTVGNYRLFSETDPETKLTITVAESVDARLEGVLESVEAMLWPLLVLIPINVLVIWASVRNSMAPVNRLKREISLRGGANLAPLDISGQPRELQPIADAVARLVERLRRALDAERASAANSAHELRTPIAGALAQTQRLVAELKSAPLRRRAEEIEETLKRLSHLSEKLLDLSRVEAGIGISVDAVDLKPVLDIVVRDALARTGPRERIHYRTSDAADLIVRMDADAFAIVLRNLIENALKHGSEDGCVDIVLEADGTVRVINEGPAVPPAVLRNLTRRFERGQSADAGSGLGLAIAETIMRQTGGTLELFSPAVRRASGFEARVQLPRVDRA